MRSTGHPGGLTVLWVDIVIESTGSESTSSMPTVPPSSDEDDSTGASAAFGTPLEQAQYGSKRSYGMPQIALDSAFHTRDATYMRRQEFLFRSNMAEQLARFERTPRTDYSSILPPTLVSRSQVLDNSTSIDFNPPRSVNPFTQDLINAHETQQHIQLQHIQDSE